MDKVGSAEPVTAPNRLAEAEVLDQGGGDGKPDEPQPGDRRDDCRGGQERHEEIDGDRDGQGAQNGRRTRADARGNEAGADVGK